MLAEVRYRFFFKINLGFELENNSEEINCISEQKPNYPIDNTKGV